MWCHMLFVNFTFLNIFQLHKVKVKKEFLEPEKQKITSVQEFAALARMWHDGNFSVSCGRFFD